MGSYDWIYVLSPLMNFAHGAQEFFADDALDDISPCAGLHRAINLLFAGVRGEHENARFREFVEDRGRAVDAAHPRQPQVHHHQAGTMFAESLQTGVAVAGLSY